MITEWHDVREGQVFVHNNENCLKIKTVNDFNGKRVNAVTLKYGLHLDMDFRDSVLIIDREEIFK